MPFPRTDTLDPKASTRHHKSHGTQKASQRLRGILPVPANHKEASRSAQRRAWSWSGKVSTPGTRQRTMEERVSWKMSTASLMTVQVTSPKSLDYPLRHWGVSICEHQWQNCKNSFYLLKFKQYHCATISRKWILWDIETVLFLDRQCKADPYITIELFRLGRASKIIESYH